MTTSAAPVSMSLYESVVAICGLPPALGPSLVWRALQTGGAGVSPQSASVEDYVRALPQIRARIKIYLAPDEAGRRIERLEQFLGLR